MASPREPAMWRTVSAKSVLAMITLLLVLGSVTLRAGMAYGRSQARDEAREQCAMETNMKMKVNSQKLRADGSSWHAAVDGSNRTYFWNGVTRKRVWSLPVGEALAPEAGAIPASTVMDAQKGMAAAAGVESPEKKSHPPPASGGAAAARGMPSSDECGRCAQCRNETIKKGPDTGLVSKSLRPQLGTQGKQEGPALAGCVRSTSQNRIPFNRRSHNQPPGSKVVRDWYDADSFSAEATYEYHPVDNVKFSQCPQIKKHPLHYFVENAQGHKDETLVAMDYGRFDFACEDRVIAVVNTRKLSLSGTCHRGLWGYGGVAHATTPIAKGETVQLTAPIIYVKCIDNPHRHEVNHFILPIPSGTTPVGVPHNVLVLQIDGVGHRQYKALMKETQSALRQLKSATHFELPNVWANGENSAPNKFRMFCGDRGVTNACEAGLFMRYYKDKAFKTAWINEYAENDMRLEMSIPFGNMGRKYIDHIVANTYHRSLYGLDVAKLYFNVFRGGSGDLTAKELKYFQLPTRAPGCVHQTHTATLHFQYVDEFLQAYSPAKNGATGTNGGRALFLNNMQAHTNDWLSVSSVDAPLAALLKRLDGRGATPGGPAGLENTIIFLLGDHGIHGSPISGLLGGEHEHRNPMATVIVPNRFLAQNKGVREVLQKNKDRMISHYDTFAAIKALADPPATAWAGADPSKEHVLRGPHGGFNYFKELVPDASCAERNIPLQYCNCWKKRTGCGYSKRDYVVES